MEDSNNNSHDVECKRMKKNKELLNKGILAQADDSSDDSSDESVVVVFDSSVNYWKNNDETHSSSSSSSSSSSISTVDQDTIDALRILREKKRNMRQQESVLTTKSGPSTGQRVEKKRNMRQQESVVTTKSGPSTGQRVAMPQVVLERKLQYVSNMSDKWKFLDGTRFDSKIKITKKKPSKNNMNVDYSFENKNNPKAIMESRRNPIKKYNNNNENNYDKEQPRS